MAPRPSTAPAFEPAPEVMPSRSPLPPGMEPRLEPGLSGHAPGAVLPALQMLWQHRRFLVQVAVRSALVFLAVALLLPANYESTTTLMPPDPQSANAGMLAALSGAGSGLLGGGSSGVMSMASGILGMKTSGALFVSILSSDTVEDRIINRFDLRKIYWVSTYHDARIQLAKHSSIQEDKKSGIISITVRDHNRQRAAQMAGAYVEELNRMVAEVNTSSAHRERIFLEDRLKVVKQNLDQASREFSDFSSKNTAIDIKEQGRAMVEAAARLQGEKIAAESELRGLEQIYTPNNVRVRSVQARITELQHQLEKLGGSASASEGGEDSDPTYPTIRQLPVLGVPYADLYRRVKINEAVFEILTKQYEIARVQEAKEVPTVKVIDPAEVPEKRSGPSRLAILLGGTAFSLCLGMAWIFGKEYWQQTSPADPRRMFAQDIATAFAGKLRWKRAREISASVVPGRFRNGSRGNQHES